MGRQPTRRQDAICAAMVEIVGADKFTVLVRDARLPRALRDEEISIDGARGRMARRIERWDQAGLRSLASDPTVQARHYLAVNEVTGRNSDPASAAIALAARGFACQKLADVLRRATEPALALFDTVTNPYGRDIELMEQIGEWAETATTTDTSPVGTVLRAMCERLSAKVEADYGTRAQANYDEGDPTKPERLDETDAEQIGTRADRDFAGVLGEIAALSLGGRPIDPDTVAAAMGFDTSSGAPPRVGPASWTLPEAMPPLISSYVSVLDDQLDAVPPMVPPTEYMLRHMLARIGITFSEHEMTTIAVVTAPAMVAVMQRGAPVLARMLAAGQRRSTVSFDQFIGEVMLERPAPDGAQIPEQMQGAIRAARDNLAAEQPAPLAAPQDQP